MPAGSILGILSDTHGRTALARRAFDIFLQQKVDYFVHCGDIGDYSYDPVPVLETLLPLPGAIVFGNNDFDQGRIKDFANQHQMLCLEAAGTFEMAGKTISVTHGDSRRLIESVLTASPGVHYLLTGHTHQKHDQLVQASEKTVRRINPGALFRTPRPSVAVLDLINDRLSFSHLGSA